MTSPPPPTKKPRYVFIDALRGVAALAVVVFHVYSKNLAPMTGFRFPEPLHTFFSNGHLGVYVFFVISGFVIAQSIQGETVTPRFAGWFALRRAVRLDLPYWATIVGMIVLTLVSNRLQSSRSLPVPPLESIAAHLVYAQGFLGYPNIVGVFWTLCYEVQFYLSLILLMGASQSLARRSASAIAASPWLLFAPLWVAALIVATGRLDLTEALFLYGWPFFFLGVAVNWIHNGQLAPSWLVVLFVSMFMALWFKADNHHFDPHEVGVAIVTASAIYLVSRAGLLATLSLGRVMQYLGRISYSLYLVHMLVGTPSMRLGIRLLGRDPSFIEAMGLTLLSTGISIAAAHVMFAFIERPATRLSQRLREKRAS